MDEIEPSSSWSSAERNTASVRCACTESGDATGGRLTRATSGPRPAARSVASLQRPSQ